MMNRLHYICKCAVGGINDSPSLSKTTEIQCLGLLEPMTDGDFPNTLEKGHKTRGEVEQMADVIVVETSIYLVYSSCLCFY